MSTPSNLAELKPGQSGRILEIGGDRAFLRRLLSLGVTPGTQVRLDRTAPLGDPIQVSIGKMSLAIRRTEASQVRLQVESI